MILRPQRTYFRFAAAFKRYKRHKKKGIGRGITHNVAVFKPQEFSKTFVFVNGVIIGDNAFAINRSLNSTLTSFSFRAWMVT